MASRHRFHDSETTQTPDTQTVQGTNGKGMLYVSGLTNETVDLRCKDEIGDSMQSVLNPAEIGNGWHPVDPLPDGEYEVQKSGSSESATTVLQVF